MLRPRDRSDISDRGGYSIAIFTVGLVRVTLIGISRCTLRVCSQCYQILGIFEIFVCCHLQRRFFVPGNQERVGGLLSWRSARFSIAFGAYLFISRQHSTSVVYYRTRTYKSL